MELIINIKMDGAAFDPAPGAEVWRLLEKMSDLQYWTKNDFASEEEITCFNLRDVNGNVCGSVRVTK